MKRLCLVVLAALAAMPVHADWLTGTTTNPGTGAVIIEVVSSFDTQSAFCVTGAASVTAVLRVQHRNAANDTTLREQYLPVGPTNVANFCVGDANDNWTILTNERIRVINNLVVVGIVSVSLRSGIVP